MKARILLIINLTFMFCEAPKTAHVGMCVCVCACVMGANPGANRTAHWPVVNVLRQKLLPLPPGDAAHFGQ